MATKIIFFNHKGGVSKTTTTYNIGWMLANKGHRVLLVDADPQCNLSGLILGDEFEQYYIEDGTKDQNIKDGVKVAFEGKPEPIRAIECYRNPHNRNLYLLPGHANLSEYDAALSFAQNSNNAITTLQNLPGAFNELIRLTGDKYGVEYVLIDLNPGLSAINQNFFVLSDAFIIPTNPDPFSIMALDTLRKILPRWVEWADRMRPIFADSSYPMSESKPKFIGSVIQRFNIRKGRAARPYRDNIAEIRRTIRDGFVPEISKYRMMFTPENYRLAQISDDYCLAEISDFQGLLPKAYNAGVPIFQLTEEQIGETGPVLEGMIRNRDAFYGVFEAISEKIIALQPYAELA
ncbi:ParA family protein [Chitinophaga sp. GbtcB8]|uniref:ParA family protein n=1 Tax=Chitinophaga sp. GbtcB8 TaxID=2824753 RepID=UPI001C302A1E|nr:ParA family protein [Chitinophaga sp. GbtcB8]